MADFCKEYVVQIQNNYFFVVLYFDKIFISVVGTKICHIHNIHYIHVSIKKNIIKIILICDDENNGKDRNILSHLEHIDKIGTKYHLMINIIWSMD